MLLQQDPGYSVTATQNRPCQKRFYHRGVFRISTKGDVK